MYSLLFFLLSLVVRMTHFISVPSCESLLSHNSLIIQGKSFCLSLMLFQSCWCYRIQLFYHQQHKGNAVPLLANWDIFIQVSLCYVLTIATVTWSTCLAIHQASQVFQLAEYSIALYSRQLQGVFWTISWTEIRCQLVWP